MPESETISLGELTSGPALGAALGAGAALGGVRTEHKGIPFAVVPAGYRLESLEKLLPPQKVEQHPKFQDAASFCEYVKRFKGPSSTLFAAVSNTGCSVVAALDYHEPGKPGWVRHRATLALKQTTEWSTWVDMEGEWFSQLEFALFLEENERLFVSPSGADLRELVLTLEGKSNARFNSAVRLQNGAVKMSYEEDVELRGSSGERPGELELPGLLICAIAPFEYMGPYEVKARLRYRIAERRLSFRYETVAAHLIVRDAVKIVLENVENQTGLRPLLGTLE